MEKIKIEVDQTKRKMSPEELEMWLHYRKKCTSMKKKKGKGSYSRKNYKLPED